MVLLLPPDTVLPSYIPRPDFVVALIVLELIVTFLQPSRRAIPFSNLVEVMPEITLPLIVALLESRSFMASSANLVSSLEYVFENLSRVFPEILAEPTYLRYTPDEAQLIVLLLMLTFFMGYLLNYHNPYQSVKHPH